MADLQERVDDIEEILAHLPEDLDARFAGVDTKLASIREVQALHTTRFSTLERKIESLERQAKDVTARMDRLEARIDRLEARMDLLEAGMGRLEAGMDRLEARMGGIEALLREVLDRLPPRQ
jgi:chromosome segregation ATPase